MNLFRGILILVCGLAAFPLSGAEPGAGDARDAILLLEEGLVHFRFHLTLNGQSLSRRRQDFVSDLMHRLDQDRDGTVSMMEWQRSPLHRFGKKEVGNAFLKSLEESRTVSRRAVEQDLLRFGEIISYRQDDAAAKEDWNVFEVLDANRSGRIEHEEILSAFQRISILDQDRDQCVGFNEFAPAPAPDVAAPLPRGLLSEELPKSRLATLLRDVGDVRLSGELLRLYDRNHDRFLTAEELGGVDLVQPLDDDHDGRISPRELHGLHRLPIAMELQIELGGTDSASSPPLQVLSASAGLTYTLPRADRIQLTLGKTSVSFVFRRLDPVQQALANARQRFNLLDGDTNGYLDRKEIIGNAPFERIWFQAMDANRDGMLYAEEMEAYVQAVCEPAATTCHINIHDLGPGYFQMLDRNGDGRISTREVNHLQQTLETYEQKPGNGIGPEEMGRNYFVEFVRGSYQIFGATSRMETQGISFLERDPIGPAWFQAIDRNRDGDLTYLPDNPLYPPEFLYSFAIARDMDVDGDGLISWEEAREYERRVEHSASPSAKNEALNAER